MSNARKANWSDLIVRLISALVMAALALGTNWLGGLVFVAFWLLAAIAVLCEWLFLTGPATRDWPTVIAACAFLILGTAFAFSGHALSALLIIAGGAIVIGTVAMMRPGRQPLLAAAALPYAACVVLPATLLRRDEPDGMLAIFVLFAIVWGSDIMAYFTGRTLGGPKLWPSVSPKKTWSGFIGGVAFGGIAAGLVAGSMLHILVGAFLAAISQGGDLLESALKRRFDAKDASHLIPGHGGVMDRLDGFLAAALAALLIGLCSAGMHPASGFVAL
jgi:phosphatidate cytidylyltransferase